jgi:hypothetical protein
MFKPRWIALFALVVSLPACGPSHKSVYSAKGRVTDADGKPAVGALVVFTRINSDPNDREVVTATGKVDESGEFTLTTYDAGDGAPEGEYMVAVTWPEEKKTPSPGPGPDRLQGAFADPAITKLRRKVDKSGPNELEPIKLTAVSVAEKKTDKKKEEKRKEIE